MSDSTFRNWPVPGDKVIFTKMLLCDYFICSKALLWQDFNAQAEDLTVWLQSRDAAGLQQEAQKGGGKVSVCLDGQTYTVVAGKHFQLPEQKLQQN